MNIMNEKIFKQSKDMLLKSLTSMNQLKNAPRDVVEAKRLMKLALRKLDGTEIADEKKFDDKGRQEWWDMVVSGATTSSITGDAAKRNLNILDNLIKQEQDKVESTELKKTNDRLELIVG